MSSHQDNAPVAASNGPSRAPSCRPSVELTAEERETLASLVHVAAGFRSVGAVAGPNGLGNGAVARSPGLGRHLRSCSLDDAFMTPLSISHPGSPRRVDVNGAHTSRALLGIF